MHEGSKIKSSMIFQPICRLHREGLKQCGGWQRVHQET